MSKSRSYIGIMPGPINVGRGRKPERTIDDYQVRDAARTIAEAERHKKDRELMKHVRRHVNEMSAAVQGSGTNETGRSRPGGGGMKKAGSVRR